MHGGSGDDDDDDRRHQTVKLFFILFLWSLLRGWLEVLKEQSRIGSRGRFSGNGSSETELNWIKLETTPTRPALASRKFSSRIICCRVVVLEHRKQPLLMTPSWPPPPSSAGSSQTEAKLKRASWPNQLRPVRRQLEAFELDSRTWSPFRLNSSAELAGILGRANAASRRRQFYN